MTEILKDTVSVSPLVCFHWQRAEKCLGYKQVSILKLLQALPTCNLSSSHLLIILAKIVYEYLIIGGYEGVVGDQLDTHF